MQGHPDSFWGKLKQEQDVVKEWHPLPDHCADVAACCEALLAEGILGRRLARLGGLPDLDEQQRARLCVIAALHDIGKFNHGFQKKADAKATANEKAGHVKEVLDIFNSRYPIQKLLYQVLPYNELKSWGAENDTGFRLLISSIAHHGNPVPLTQKPRVDIWEKGTVDPFAGIADLVARIRNWFPIAFQSGGPPLPGSSEFQHGFSGLVTLADWIGSDTKVFRYSEVGDPERFGWAQTKVKLALQQLGISAALSRASLKEIG